MTQLKNAKVLAKGDKLFLIDAPEKDSELNQSKAFPGYPNIPGWLDRIAKKEKSYEEALSKAPTWEIKNQEEVRDAIYQSMCTVPNCTDLTCNCEWLKENKLYDLPKGYKVKFEEIISKYTDLPNNKYAILIPQESGLKYQNII